MQYEDLQIAIHLDCCWRNGQHSETIERVEVWSALSPEYIFGIDESCLMYLEGFSLFSLHNSISGREDKLLLSRKPGYPDEDPSGDWIISEGDFSDAFAGQGHRCHVGNIHWCRFQIDALECIRLLNHLQFLQWQCIEAGTTTYEKWNNRHSADGSSAVVPMDLTDLGFDRPALVPGLDFPDPNTLDMFAGQNLSSS